MVSGGSESNTIDGYLEYCYTRTISTAADLHQSLFSARGTPENRLLEFYDMFYQLWQLTRHKMITKRAEDAKMLDGVIADWFKRCMGENRNRKTLGIDLANSGLEVAESWIELLNTAGIVGVK